MKEALVSAAVGFGINYIANIVVLNAFALPVGPGKSPAYLGELHRD